VTDRRIKSQGYGSSRSSQAEVAVPTSKLTSAGNLPEAEMKTLLLLMMLFVPSLSVNSAAPVDLTGAWKLDFKPDFS
jgi:hypothetical protein